MEATGGVSPDELEAYQEVGEQPPPARSASSEITAVVMAGGRGTRLVPFTFVLPKPLIPLGDIPIIEVMIAGLAQHGITRIVFCLGHMAEIVVAYMSGVQARFPALGFGFVRESTPLGTAGPLKLVGGRAGKDFIVSNGDILTDIDYSALIEFHRNRGAALTVATYVKRARLDLGVVVRDASGVIRDYVEKPAYEHLVSMGIYVCNERVLHYIEAGEHLDFNDLVLRLVGAGENVMAYPFEGTWLDIGKPDDYAAALEVFANDPDRYMPSQKAGS